VRVMMNSFNARASPQRLEVIYPMGHMPKPSARVGAVFLPTRPPNAGDRE